MRIDGDAFDRSIDAEASSWVLRHRAGLDEAGERDLAAWLSARPEHRASYDRLLAMAAVFPRVRAQGAERLLLNELESRFRKRRLRRKTGAAGAAAIVALAAVFWLSPKFDQPADKTRISTVPFEPIRRLPDGSIVELKEGAEIAVRFETALRRVALIRGEALFRVEHDSSRPFVVSVSGVEVRAVGTAFNVRLSSEIVEVLVTEGKVGLDDALHGHTLLSRLPAANISSGAAGIEPVLTAGQEAVIEIKRPSDTKVVQLGPDEIRRSLSWRLPRLNFEGIELAQAIHRINERNRVQIVLADAALGKLRLSGTFSPDDPETFSRLVAASFGLKARRRNEEVIVLFRN